DHAPTLLPFTTLCRSLRDRAQRARRRQAQRDGYRLDSRYRSHGRYRRAEGRSVQAAAPVAVATPARSTDRSCHASEGEGLWHRRSEEHTSELQSREKL